MHNSGPDLPDGERPVQHPDLDHPVLHGPEGHPAAAQAGQSVLGALARGHAGHALLQRAREHEPHRAPVPHRPLQAAPAGRVQAEIIRPVLTGAQTNQEQEGI